MTAQTKRTADTKGANDTHDDTHDDRSGIGSTVADAAGTIRSVATDAAERIPEVASATRSALVEVDRQVEAGRGGLKPLSRWGRPRSQP